MEKSFPVVRLFDRAVRWSDGKKDGCTDARAYGETRDFDLIVLEPGKRAMVFHTKRLLRSQMRDVEGLGTEPVKREVAFAYGVESVEMPDGRVIRPKGDRWTSEEMDAEGFDFPTVEDIGAIVVQRSRLPFGWPGSFVAPPSSARASALLLFPTAVRSQADAPKSKSEPGPPASEP